MSEADPILPPPEVFTKKELTRLGIYRAAVLADFYTDQCDSPPRSRAVAELLHQPISSMPSAPEVMNGDMNSQNHKPGEDCGNC